MSDNSTAADPVARALEAFKKGEDVGAAVYGEPSNSAIEPDSDSADNGWDTDESPLDAMLKEPDSEDGEEAEDTASPSEDTDDSELAAGDALDSMLKDSSDPAVTSTDIETILVKSANGKKQKLEVNYSDKKAIKDAFIKAAGMRKFQAERDTLRTQSKELEAKYNELQQNWDKLESVFDDGKGMKALVEMLGGAGSFEKLVQQEADQKEYLENLTPSERRVYDMDQQKTALQAEREAERARYESQLSKLQEQQELASQRSLESKLHPAFDRYRFSGKLGDEVAEHQLDEAVWGQALKRLEQYPDDVEITQGVIDKEFRTVANTFKKLLKGETDKKVSAVIDRKKSDSMNKVQAVAKKGLSGNTSARKQFAENMRGGDMVSALSSLLSGNIKL